MQLRVLCASAVRELIFSSRRVRAIAAFSVGLTLAGNARAQAQQLTALCSTDPGWCELAAKEFQAQTGIKVLQVHKATGEALAQLRAESQNPKTDLW